MNSLKHYEQDANFFAVKIERDLAKLIKDKVGKGPDSIEVRISNDMVVCLMRGFMTKAEELITETGDYPAVCKARAVFLIQCQTEIDDIIKGLLNRRVKHLFPGFTTDTQLGNLTIYLD